VIEPSSAALRKVTDVTWPYHAARATFWSVLHLRNYILR